MTDKIRVYAAGPVSGCTNAEAKNWRKQISDALSEASDGRVVCVSPVRCETSRGKRFKPDSSGHFYTPRGISAKNWFDTERCDIVLAYFPESHFSLGTALEVGWAIGMRKPVILVTDDGWVANNPLIQHNIAYEIISEKDLPLSEDIPEEVLEQIVEIVLGLTEVYYEG